MNLKKLLSAIGLLSVAVPASLSVVACGDNQTDANADKVISSINKIEDLQIAITSNDTKGKVFDILNNKTNGLAEVISKHKNVDKSFKKESFKLDTNNVFTDKDKKNKVDKDQEIAIGKTYYFQYSYASKKNNVLVPVKIINKDQEIVNAITNADYGTTTMMGTTATDFKKTITTDFIKNGLTDDIKNSFDGKLLEIGKIKIANKDITDTDLSKSGTIYGSIDFKYATIEGSTDLTINITATDQAIVNAINAAQYTTTTTKGTIVENFKNTITESFIKRRIDRDIVKDFNWANFKLVDIKNGENPLSDADLNQVSRIQATIEYTYTGIEGSTNLTINVKETDQAIVNAITNADYGTTTMMGTTATDFKKTITNDFIKNGLTGDIKNSFDGKLLTIGEIKKDDKELTNDDLSNPGTVLATINYTYATIKGTTNLSIDVTATDQAIVNAINAAQYTTTTTKGTTVENFKNTITGEFIKEKIAHEIQKDFKWADFLLVDIKNGENSLSDADLNKVSTIQAKIEYIYTGIEETQSTNLTINIIGSITDANVDNVTFENNPTTVEDLLTEFTPANIIKNEEFVTAINSKISNEDIVKNASNYKVENIYTEPNDKTAIAEDKDVIDGATLYIKVIGQKQLSGSVMLKLEITNK